MEKLSKEAMKLILWQLWKQERYSQSDKHIYSKLIQALSAS